MSHIYIIHSSRPSVRLHFATPAAGCRSSWVCAHWHRHRVTTNTYSFDVIPFSAYAEYARRVRCMCGPLHINYSYPVRQWCWLLAYIIGSHLICIILSWIFRICASLRVVYAFQYGTSTRSEWRPNSRSFQNGNKLRTRMCLEGGIFFPNGNGNKVCLCTRSRHSCKLSIWWLHTLVDAMWNGHVDILDHLTNIHTHIFHTSLMLWLSVCLLSPHFIYSFSISESPFSLFRASPWTMFKYHLDSNWKSDSFFSFYLLELSGRNFHN